jgi:hypothetical protein
VEGCGLSVNSITGHELELSMACPDFCDQALNPVFSGKILKYDGPVG